MNRLLHAVSLCLALAAPLAQAAPTGLAGHYYLERGPREVGSELLLKEGGRFEWMLTYGTQDLAAGGTWRADGKQVVLTAAPAPEPVFRTLADEEYEGAQPVDPGRWIAAVGIMAVPPLRDVEVRFEARSGKAATAVTGLNGAAIVTMPAGETWVRAGLRRFGSGGTWQWFDVAPARAQARLAGFALTNPEAQMTPPFTAVKLRIEADGLAVDGDLGGLRGTYVKH
jgi:hypothetical protein